MSIPVVIGSGLTGLSISHSLSRASIDHVLIGRRPDMSPRLGESMNLEGTLLLWEMFPQLSRFFFPKAQVLGYLAGHEVVCDFDVGRRFVSRLVFRAMGYAPAEEFLQVDRLGFDAALWELTTSEAHCTVLDAQVAGLDFDAARDRFTSVRLADGTTLEPSYLFDATNHGRLLGQTANLTYRTLSVPQRVAYTHYHLPPGAPNGIEAWERTTAIVRLFAETDGMEAIAWCIPLGDYVSIGVSMSADESPRSDEELLEQTATAFVRYGIEYRRRFSERAEVKGLRHSYFVYERAYGANWLLAGPSFCQVWWMAGAGVGTALAAARLAPRLLADPVRWGGEYDRNMKRLETMQEVFDYFALTPREGYEPRGLHHFSDRFVINNLTRLAASARMRESRLARVAYRGLEWLFARPGTIREYCSVLRASNRAVPVDDYRSCSCRMTTGAVGGPVIRTADEAVVARLLAAIGDGPLSEAVYLLAPDVVCHMDRFTARGADVWVDWVLFIRSRGVENLKVVVDRYETGADGIITAFGGLTAGFEGTTSPRAGTARYRVVDGRIVEIWTSRWNYEIIFGPRVRRPLSWLLVLVRMALWRRLSRLHAARSHLTSEDAAFDGAGDKSRHGSSADHHPQR